MCTVELCVCVCVCKMIMDMIMLYDTVIIHVTKNVNTALNITKFFTYVSCTLSPLGYTSIFSIIRTA